MRESLGERCVELLLEEVRRGRIKVPTMKIMAGLMGGTVSGVFEEEREEKKRSPEQVMLAMLDCWNNEGNDGSQELIAILENRSIGQFALAKEIAEKNMNCSSQESHYRKRK